MITEQSAQFYAKIASNHDRIYDRAERQEDLEAMRGHVAEVLRGHTVLELACGTGYWTPASSPKPLTKSLQPTSTPK
ncbi:hypothetical protein LP420_07525 [Massilia sp. B-10]|nr:hypothetical protein LP420_07525 [Massilia sp. B-10]